MPKVNLVRPDGTVVGVDASKVKLYESLGYRAEAPEESAQRLAQEEEAKYYTGGENAVWAAVEGGLSGATLGASTFLRDSEGERKRAQYNQAERIGGELVGALVTSISPKTAFTPSGMLSEFTGNLARGGGLVRKAAAAGVEGAVQGAGAELSRASLAEDPITVESLAAGGGLGLVLGLAGGAVAHGISTGSAKLRGPAQKTVEEEFLAATSNTGTPGRTFDYGQPDYQKAARGREARIPNSDSAVEARNRAAEALLPQEKWDEMRGLIRDLRTSSDRLVNQVDEAHNMAKVFAKNAEDAIPVAPALDAVPDEAAIVRGDAEFAPPPVREARAFDPLKGRKVPDSAFEPPAPPAKPDYGKHLAEVGEIGTDAYSAALTDNTAPKAKIARLRATWRHARESLKSGNPTKIENAIAKYKEAILDLDPAAKLPELQAPKGKSPKGKAASDAGVYTRLGPEFEQQAFDEALQSYTPPSGGDVSVGGLAGQLDADAASLGAGVDASLAQSRLNTAAKSVEEVIRFNQAVRNLKVPANPAEFFTMGGDAVESVFAGFEAVLKNSAPEAKPLQAALTDVIDRLALSTGLDVPEGNAISRLRAVHAAGKQVQRTAGDKWEQRVWGPEAEGISIPGLSSSIEEANAQGLNTGHLVSPEKVAKETERTTLMQRFGRNLERAAAYTALGVPAGWGAKAALVTEILGMKARVMGVVKNAVARRGETIAKAAKLTGTRVSPLLVNLHGIPDPKENLKDAFAARSRELREAMVSAKDRAFMTAQGLTAAGHPGFAKGTYDHVSRVIDALSARLPRLPQGTTWGEESVFDWPEEQIEVYGQVWQAGVDPMSFMQFAAENPQDVFPEAARTLEEAYPALYAEWRTNVIQSLDFSKMTLEELDGWSAILDTSLIPTHRPEFVAAQAAMFIQAQQPQTPPKGITTPVGRPPENGQDATPSQRQMMR